MIRAADLDSPLPNGWTLFQHQKDAVMDCIKQGRVIMAFDMGLGKTLISLLWAKAVASVIPGCATVVIVPCTLIETWRREATMLGFDVYGHGVLASRFSITIHSWAKIPTPAEVGRKFLLIADEAHAMQVSTPPFDI
jgi:superfamily II DNA or RNA helicase